jgi:hypothetical protein
MKTMNRWQAMKSLLSAIAIAGSWTLLQQKKLKVVKRASNNQQDSD